MDIKKLSKDQMEVILNELLKQKSIDYNFISGTLMASPTNEMKRCADSMHSLLCDAEHHETNGCQYYEEEGFDDCWVRANHMQWLKRTISFMKETSIDDEPTLRSAISIARQRSEEILREHPSVRTLLLLILKRL